MIINTVQLGTNLVLVHVQCESASLADDMDYDFGMPG
jgi:hypothetical protein